MRKLILVLAVIALLSATVVHASGTYFIQDDFLMLFGATGNPGASGGSFTAATTNGYLKDWMSNSNIYKFSVSGSTTGALLVGSEYETTYTPLH